MLDEWSAKRSAMLHVVLESNSFEMLRYFVRDADALTFQIEIGGGVGAVGPGLVSVPIDDRDMTHGPLVLAQLRGRALPVAAAAFAEHLGRALDSRRTTPMIEIGPAPG